MNRERQLLHAWLCIAPHIVDPMYEKLHKTTKEFLNKPEPELIGFVAESSVGFDVSLSVQSMPLLWLGKLEHGDKLYRVGKKGE